MNDYYIQGTWGSCGEAYHVAMHGLLVAPEEADHFGIRPENKSQEKALFEFLNDLGIKYWTDDRPHARKMGLSETANTIFLRYHRDQVRQKRWIIEGMSRDQDWKNPFEDKLSEHKDKPKVLIWQRKDLFEPWRNTEDSLTKQIIRELVGKKITPVLIGNEVGDRYGDFIHLGNFWTDKFFQNGHNLCKQLWFQHDLFEKHNVLASVGMMSGGMDGAALFFNHNTIFIARESDAKPRMAKLASVVPGLNWLRVEYSNDGLKKLNESQLKELCTKSSIASSS